MFRHAPPTLRTGRRRSGAVALVAAAAASFLPAVPAEAAPTALPASWSTLVNAASGKCLDARAAGTADGTAVQQYACNNSAAQQWSFTTTGNGWVRINNRPSPDQVVDVTGVSTADNATTQLWAYGGGANQQWQPVDEGGGAYRFVNRNSGKCLDDPGASLADSVQLVQYTCNGSAAQRFQVVPVAQAGGDPDLGPNVVVFDPSMSASAIQTRLTSIFKQQETNQFGSQRYAVLFKPGAYSADVNVGFYTQVLGLGLSPDAVTISGAVHAEADWFQGNATQNFWRGAENLSVNPTGGSDRWAVSQAAAYRRMHLRGNLALDDGGWSSGGLLADSKVDGQVRSGSQQQWLTRNSQLGSWTGANWNMVFVGSQGVPATSFPNPPYTTVAQTPVSREKPFLYVDGAGAYQVFVPSLRTGSTATSWAGGSPAGSSLSLDSFYVVKPGATAAQIDQALAAGKNLLFTPGVYHLDRTLQVDRPDTVVLGLGLATLVPDKGVTAMKVADVDGVKIAGLLLDAGTTNSSTLMEVGPAGSSASHAADPTSLHDVYFRVGGAGVGKATTSLVVNSDDVIGDHMWIWRADHGSGVGWTSNTADTGLVVNGDDVTMYGLFVEHFQKYQTVWNGNGGRTYFYQNEMPYDPPGQAAWMNGSTQGYAAYKVADSVTAHQAYGLGSYCYFNVDPRVTAARAIEAPNRPNVRFTSMLTVSLGGTGTISHVVNTTGGPSNSASNVANLTTYP
ncbi:MULTISPECIES: RICIN domain-containing protein [unclassified Streptomyces]|uniref:RICIN domain-containing protein n=1 Tax=Streptomyces doudnae TaxID=3075536 RepID=A0ABD5ER83_9ACTN|nr:MULTISPECIES: RICIN domain-containing protein [unclassified Streptomyces]MDT0436803.1 RICIN domain-containing protein [Streptomyces sp. DSM 41981]MYQ66870.1 coagulation factor 5/8 type domain-containing protein [Streptomyces sp. SID4950]SCE26611.1 Ricin-type beta-trefoil lectin domain-containing protein [Streptomyces sp. SolWspMP-5a-2]